MSRPFMRKPVLLILCLKSVGNAYNGYILDVSGNIYKYRVCLESGQTKFFF